MDIKQKLVYAYRILSMLGMDDHTYTHLSARDPDNPECYYIQPFGVRFAEVNVQNLIKIDFTGNILEGSEYQYNKTAYVIHGSIYKQRPDITSVFHLHTISTVAVSALKDGLLPISQWALVFYEKLAYHEYNSLALDESEQGKDLSADLEDKYVMILRNHGFIACGKTVQEAMFYTYLLEQAAKAQCYTLGQNQKLVVPSHEIRQKACSDMLNFEKDLGRRDWEAWVRMVDNKYLQNRL
ncbi:class II aldolase/adducin family protein [Rickettsia endosymbiont of Cardiosporidium cionae]|uniref:class II aldolase/adducin family protein n=1 Tax=Rickettsia endosymbiont of Cardiosporidium cionae TaxID=2777155 RepID=UPI0018941E0F|nr:class II aldolase/adducin family protein [Rickettsia endosymbiont of Cardiosporidium cionae]KAF8818475.1 hypothetical protein IHI24_000566 [Rickettsia endosymbiont of Cardiosporidium cionae]